MNPEKLNISSREHVNEGLEDLFDERLEEKDADWRSKKGGVKAALEEKKLQEETETRAQYENFDKYQTLLVKYKGVWNKIKQLEKKHRNNLTDPEISSSLRILEEERHGVHLEALEIATKLGKNKNEVTADILNREGNLEEFGLPEFTLCPANREFPESGVDYSLLIFNIDDSEVLVHPLYYSTHNERMQELAKELNLPIEEHSFNLYHNDYLPVSHCIKVSDDQLEKVASIIRNNPNRFRLKEEYFSESEKAEAGKLYQESVRHFLKKLIGQALKRDHGNRDEAELIEEVLREFLSKK